MDQEARNRLARLNPVAVIDIGSNTVRLVIFEGLNRSPTQLHNESVACRLGAGIDQTGRLSSESMERALRTLRRFRALIDHMGIKSFHPFATAAARSAANGPEFVRCAEAICRCPIEILSGEREAELTANGILSGFVSPDGIVGDIGGRSLELANVAKGPASPGDPRPVSLALGHLRVKERCGDDIEAATAMIDEALENVEWLKIGNGRNFYAVGGEWRALARLHMISRNYPLRIYHGYQIPFDEALNFTRDVAKGETNQISGIDRLSRARRETIRQAAAVLWRVLKQVEPSQLIISAFGVREGLLYTLLDEKERRRDPLIAACEEAALVGGRSLTYAQELCNWTDELFRTVGQNETMEERRLRHAACLLSDIGWRAHPDYRGEQSLNLSAHWAVAGVDHPGRAFIALTNYYRHMGTFKGEVSPVFRELLHEGEDGERARARAKLLGSAIRAAYMISAGTPGVISKTPLHLVDDKLILELPEAYREFDGERLRQRVVQVADNLGLEAEIRISGKRGGISTLVSAISERLR